MSKPENLMEIIYSITDPRVKGRSKYPLSEIIAIAACAVLCGAESWVEISDWGRQKYSWLKKFLALENGIPSHDTFGRVFSILDPESMQKMFIEWVNSFSFSESEKNLIHIDGKFLNGSLKAGNSRTSTSIVTAWSSTLGVVLGMKDSELKKNLGEKKATEKLLENLYLKGCLVTLDAGGATLDITSKVREKGGDFVIGLKDNQKELKNFGILCMSHEKHQEKINVYETKETGHGRSEIRRYSFFSIDDCDVKAMPTIYSRIVKKWGKLLGGFCKVETTIKKNGKTRVETRYYFTSLKKGVEEVAQAIRSHWSVENTVHWTMDVTFREDSCRTRMKHSAANLGLIRRMALNFLKREESQERSMRRKRKLCGWDTNYLEKVLWGGASF